MGSTWTAQDLGPWAIGHTRQNDGSVAVLAGGKRVARVDAGPDSPDARLIAAAPELLEALREAVAWADTMDIGEPGDGDPIAGWRAAIAKAQGES